MPVDRETGRPRGFAFVEFAERTVAEQVIDKFNAQPFQGRNLAVSEARARNRPRVFVHLVEGSEARVPAAVALADRVPVAAASGVRVQAAVALVVAAVALVVVAAASAVRAAAAIARRTSDRPRLQSDCAAVRRPRDRNTSQGPIKERSDGRIYAVDDLDDGETIDFDDIATKAKEAQDAADADATKDVEADVTKGHASEDDD